MTDTLIVVQARMQSERLPGKALAVLSGRPVLEWVVERVRALPFSLLIATGDTAENKPIIELADTLEIQVIRGPENDVMTRYGMALEAYPDTETIVRVTGDNPLTAPELIETIVKNQKTNGADYAFALKAPYGTSADAFKASTLRRLVEVADAPRHREHINTFILDNHLRFDITGVSIPKALKRSDVRVTLDTADDFARLQAIFGYIQDPIKADVLQIIEAYDQLPSQLKASPFPADTSFL